MFIGGRGFGILDWELLKKLKMLASDYYYK